MDVPETDIPLSDSSLLLIQRQFPDEVILASNNHAVDVYSDVLQFVNENI